MTVGDRIRQCRIEIGKSVEDVALELGVSSTTVYRYENGGIEKMGIDKLAPIAAAVGTTPAYLMGWEAKRDMFAGVSANKRKLIEMILQFDDEKIEAFTTLAKAVLDKRGQ